MDIDNTQGAAEPSPASVGSHGSNGLVAYYVHGSEYDTGCEFAFVTLLREHAEAAGGDIATLVRLTDAEREAIEFLAEACKWWSTREGQSHVAVIRGLLDRTK